MTHRNAFALILAAPTSWSAPAARRPNVLFCFADDWGRYASIYRDPGRPGFNDVINTPALDRIGRAGVVFNNAFVSAPSCTPCAKRAIRASSTAATRSTNRPLWVPTSFRRPRGRRA